MAVIPSEVTCRKCGRVCPVDEGYAPWCDACGWNLVPAAQRTPEPSPREQARNARQQRVYERVAARDVRKPRPDLAAWLGMALAAIVQGLGLVAIIGAIALLIWGFPSPVAIAVAIGLIGGGWAFLPQFGRLPRDASTREQLPELFALLDEIADALDAPRVHRVAIVEGTDSAFAQLGFRRRGLLTIGLARFHVLAPQERVALLAHEVAHAVDGDPRRGVLIGGSLGNMRQLAAELRRAAAKREGALWIFYKFWAALPASFARVLEHSTATTTQRAEHYADVLAARVAGTEAVVGALAAIPLDAMWDTACQRARRNPDANVYDELRARLAIVPERELERSRRRERLPGRRTDDAHPPTGLRIELLERVPRAPKVTSTDVRADVIDRELAARRAELSRQALAPKPAETDQDVPPSRV
jgi:Zn-dependent protease with chaperone function